MNAERSKNTEAESPRKPGIYLVRLRWYNKMNRRQFCWWQMCEYNGRWATFSGAEVVEWKEV